MTKQWVSVELCNKDAESFKSYLKEHGIYFEPSSCGTYVHIEVFATSEQISAANNFLDNLAG